MKRWMIYGANGYTGEIIARLARAQGLMPVLAGRNRTAVELLAHELELEASIFDLSEDVAAAIRGCELVLHCAGPFVETSVPMADACIAARVHYVDITGEIPVFAGLHARDRQALDSGVMLLGGGGFDVVPTDCVALKLKEALPGATLLRLAFDGVGEPSGGTTRSALAQLSAGGKVRENGQVVTIPLLGRTTTANLGGRSCTVYSVPWGDVFTAYYTTGIQNIEVYKSFSSAEVVAAKAARPFLGVLGFEPLLKLAQSFVGRAGPSDESRAQGTSYVWGHVSDGKESVELQLDTIEGYQFTAHSAVAIAARILRGEFRAGYQTPAAVYGADLTLDVPGTRFHSFTRG